MAGYGIIIMYFRNLAVAFRCSFFIERKGGMEFEKNQNR